MMNERIRAAMKEKGISAKALAHELGITEPTMSRYLNGRSTMSYSMTVQACEFLGIPLTEIGDDNGLPHPDFGGDNAELFRNALDVYDASIREKDKQIEELKKEKAEMQKKIDRKDKMLFVLALIVAAFAIWNIYYTIDSHNGDWGLVRYEDGHLEIVPKASETTDDGTDWIDEWPEEWSINGLSADE